MLNWTTRHCRYFHRLLSPNTVLYTEMITSWAILRGNRNKLLDFNTSEKPLVLQLGGNDAKQMTQAAKIAQDFGYDAVNINVGCPSAKVHNGKFGACLMQTPAIVADCIYSMDKELSIPISVKSRTGIDNNNNYQTLFNFVNLLNQAGCNEFIIHARNAILTSGLNPKQNRNIPPLNYAFVYKLAQDFPQVKIHLNGGVKTLAEIKRHIQKVSGVMLGRAFYHNPYLLSQVEQEFNSDFIIKSREQIIAQMYLYIKQQIALGVHRRSVIRHMLGLYYACENAKKFRQNLLK